MGTRIRLALIVIGCLLVFIGFREFRVSGGTTAKPAAVDLAALERDEATDNNHVQIGEHVAVYGTAVYEYEESRFAAGEPGPDTKVNHCYYPIISPEHPFIEALNKLVEEHGGLDNLPDEVSFPEIADFAVLVKTRRFKTVGAIPGGLADEASVQGLVINRIASLGDEEEKLVKESFPSINLETVLILEEGRKPASLGKSLGMLFGGLALAVLGLGLFIAGRLTRA